MLFQQSDATSIKLGGIWCSGLLYVYVRLYSKFAISFPDSFSFFTSFPVIHN